MRSTSSAWRNWKTRGSGITTWSNQEGTGGRNARDKKKPVYVRETKPTCSRAVRAYGCTEGVPTGCWVEERGRWE